MWVRLTNPLQRFELTDGFGAYCTRPCEDATDWAFGLRCEEVPDTGWSVCFPPTG